MRVASNVVPDDGGQSCDRLGCGRFNGRCLALSALPKVPSRGPCYIRLRAAGAPTTNDGPRQCLASPCHPLSLIVHRLLHRSDLPPPALHHPAAAASCCSIHNRPHLPSSLTLTILLRHSLQFPSSSFSIHHCHTSSTVLFFRWSSRLLLCFCRVLYCVSSKPPSAIVLTALRSIQASSAIFCYLHRPSRYICVFVSGIQK